MLSVNSQTGILYLVIIILTLLSLLLDIFFYPGFCKKHLFIDSRTYIFLFITLSLIWSLCNKIKLSPKILSLNKKFIFPSLLILSTLFFFLDGTLYRNFVFNHFHINTFHFLFLPVLSGTIIYLDFKDLKKYKYIYIIPPLIFLSLIFIHHISEDIFGLIINEDGVLEITQFLMFLASSVISFLISIKFRAKNKTFSLVFLLCSISMFFVAGEEISWGQRILFFSTPEILYEINTQKETTLHNISTIQSALSFVYMSIGLYGAFSRKILKRFFPQYFQKYEIFTPPEYLVFCFITIFLYYLLHDFVFKPFGVWLGNTPIIKWQEVFETFLSIGIVCYFYSTLKNLSSSKTN
ncbi:MAG TPA: hypothetical protein VLH94_00055 [Spirochaetia bacterium]|nr:hypothetical protein [Spirochaetia bacterium]